MTQAIKRKILKLVIWLVILSLGTLFQRYVPSNQMATQDIQPGFYRVLEFYDGDTIAVDMNGVGEKVRFIGVDTPETHDPRKPVQCFGYAASDFTKQLIGNQPVRLEADATSGNRDRYNRLLRYVYLPDGTLVNQTIIEAGYGHAYLSFPFSKMTEFEASADRARQNQLGLWSAC